MIRKLEPEDIGRVAEIHVFAWRTTYRFLIDDSYLFCKLSVEKSRKSFERILSDKQFDVLILEENKIIMGFIVYGQRRNALDVDTLEVLALYVDPLMKRNGVGRQLFQAVEEKGLKNGYSRIKLSVAAENKDTIKFYEAMGMCTPGTTKLNETIGIHTLDYTKPILLSLLREQKNQAHT